MALCVTNEIQMQGRINKCALKLLGISRFELTDEEILECVSSYIDPSNIEALFFDTFNNYYVLFLYDIDATCRLVGKKVESKSDKCINIYPLLECYVIDNVYPCLRNEELRDIFTTFGNVFSVSNHHVVPNSTKFSHILSGKREITFLLPGEELEIYIPINVVHPPYSFNVKKFCCACLTEGHSLLYCPDIEDDKSLPEIKYDGSDSDGELEALIKSEDINFEDTKVEDTKVEDSLIDTQRKFFLFTILAW
ncbi:hypothetical protein AVEN_268609-1 [Araneus ventricosus]|uniref:Uncharacterized protein n=1 Tax=Araneus ventricosus TaxID=182803 RepID=A0A4Y2H0Q0_ARAVE|nr:hypothetical protein AVEN_268609-1 [Araneus ventricosus]